MGKESVGVQVKLEGNALKIVLFEQSKRDGHNKITGKARMINILLCELFDRRLKDSVVPPTPMNNKTWKKFLKAE